MAREKDREAQTLKGLLAITGAVAAIELLYFAALATARYPIEEPETEIPIVYDRAPETKEPIEYVEDVCPVCGKEAIASEDYLVCNNQECEMEGIPVKK